MLRPWLRVARPDDGWGVLAGLGTGTVGAVLVLVALLVRLPAGWVTVFGGQAWAVRAVLVLAALWCVGWLRTLVFSRLPAAPYLAGKRLVFRVRGKTVRVAVSEVEDVRVERRDPPVREAFVVVLKNGGAYDLCPVAWAGAPQLYRALRRKTG